MASHPPDWRDAAKQVYRLGQEELLADRPVWDEVEFYVDDLREALLDLKQSVIDDRETDALACMDEVILYVAELKRRRGES